MNLFKLKFNSFSVFNQNSSLLSVLFCLDSSFLSCLVLYCLALLCLVLFIVLPFLAFYCIMSCFVLLCIVVCCQRKGALNGFKPILAMQESVTRAVSYISVLYKEYKNKTVPRLYCAFTTIMKISPRWFRDDCTITAPLLRSFHDFTSILVGHDPAALVLNMFKISLARA